MEFGLELLFIDFQKLPDSLFQVHIRRHANYLYIHMSCLFELEWHIPLEKEIVHVSNLSDIIH